MSVIVEIIAIGNELLTGDVLDTNSHWLCRQLTGLGATVRQVSQIGDDQEQIAETIRAALSRGAEVVITIGGLGPTDDDRTLAGVAQALDRPLCEHADALAWVHQTYARLARQGYVASPELTPARAKMAKLPEGAVPLRNTVGAAPGVLLKLDKRTLICLPGVPAELRDIFRHALRSELSALLGEGYFLEWQATVNCGDESVLAPVLRRVAAAHPDVYCKSRARRFGKDVTFTLTLATRASDHAAAQAQLEAAWHALAEALTATGIDILSVEPMDMED